MRTEPLGSAYLALPDGPGLHPGLVVVHEAFGLNDNIRDVCRRLAAEAPPVPRDGLVPEYVRAPDAVPRR